MYIHIYISSALKLSCAISLLKIECDDCLMNAIKRLYSCEQ